MNAIYPMLSIISAAVFFQQKSSITIKDHKSSRVSLIDDANFDHVPTQIKQNKINIHTHISKEYENRVTNLGQTCITCLLHLAQKNIFSSGTTFLLQTHAVCVPPLIRIYNKFYCSLHYKARLLQKIT